MEVKTIKINKKWLFFVAFLTAILVYAFYPGVKTAVDDWAVNTFGEQVSVAWHDFSVGMTHSVFWINYVAPNMFTIGLFTGMILLGGFILVIKPHLPARKSASTVATKISPPLASTPIGATTRPVVQETITAPVLEEKEEPK